MTRPLKPEAIARSFLDASLAELDALKPGNEALEGRRGLTAAFDHCPDLLRDAVALACGDFEAGGRLFLGRGDHTRSIPARGTTPDASVFFGGHA